MADPPHSVPPGGGQPDPGSTSGFLGQRKSKAGPGSAAVQGAGSPRGDQSTQLVMRQPGSEPGSRSGNLGQRKRAGPGSAADQGAGAPGGHQPSQQDTGQPGSGDLTGAGKGLSTEDGRPTVQFKSGSNIWRAEKSPLTYQQWQRLFHEKKMLCKLFLMFGAKSKKEGNVITFTIERPLDDPQWAHKVLQELKEMSSKIGSAEVVISVQLLESFEDQWEKEELSKTDFVTCFYERSTSQCTMTILSEDEKLLHLAEERANTILGTLEPSVIGVPWPHFDEHCFQRFIQRENFPTIHVLYKRETHEIQVIGPLPEREKVSTKISSLVEGLEMKEMNWPEAGNWMSQTKNSKYLSDYMEEHYPGVLPVIGGKSLFLLGPKIEVEIAQDVLQKMICTREHQLSEDVWKSLMQSIGAEEKGEGSYFIPKFFLLASHDLSKDQMKLAGPLGYHKRLLQLQIKLHLKEPAPGVLAALKNESAKGFVSITTRTDNVEIEGPVEKVQEAYQLIAEAHANAHREASDENLPKAEDISQDRLVNLLLMDSVKNAVNEHLSLLGKNLENVTWSVDKTTSHLKIKCKDTKKREETEREIKNMFAEREIIMKDLDTAASYRLQDSWPELVEELHEFNNCCIASFAADKKWVLLATFIDRLDHTSQRLADLMLFYQKDRETQTLPISTAQLKYLMKACGKEVTTVKDTIQREGGTFRIQSAGDDIWQVEVTGSPTLVSSAVRRLRQLRDDIYLADVADAAISCLTSKEGKKFISSLEEKYKCYVHLPEAAMDGHGKTSDFAEVVLAAGATVSLQRGPLKAEGVDLVALPVPVDLESKMTPTKPPEEYSKILPDLRTHIPRLCEKVRKGKEKVLLVTPPRKLSCRKVALMAVPSKWDDGKKGEKKFVRSAVTELMETTMGEKCSSVAFEIPRHLPVNAAETPVLVGLREFFEKETEEAAPPTGIRTVKLFTSRQTDSRDLYQLLENAFAGLSNSAQRKIVVAAADKRQAKEAAQELSKFAAIEQQESENFFDGEGARKGMENLVHKDVSRDFPNMRKHACTSSRESILNAVDDILKKLVGCSISNSAGRLLLHFPSQKEHLAFAVCQHCDNMVGAAEAPSFPSSTAHQNVYDEVLVNAAKIFFPEMLRKVRVKKNENGKFVFTPALSEEDHNLMSSLQQSEVQVKDDEKEKAKTIYSAFLKDPDIYVEYLPSKKVVVAVVRKYDFMQVATQRIKLHLGQIKTAVRGRRQFSTQPGESDGDARGASAAAAEEGAEEATGVDNKITLPGGLVVIPYRDDIIKLKVDAIVNAADERLANGAGVARSIAAAGGPELNQECRDYIDLNGPVPVSGVCVTGPGRLPCTRVIHAVGPCWDSRTPELCRQQLYDTVLNCCREADKWELGEIAMPPIGSGSRHWIRYFQGIFGVPKEECTEMYCKALLDYDQQPHKKLKTVHFVDIKDDMPLALLKALRKVIGQGQQRTRSPEADVDTSQGCVVCTEKDFDQPVKLNDCNHVFCKACIEAWFKEKPTCPSCNKVYGIITGTMPPGTMNVSRERYTRLAGFENCGCIVINYSFNDGIQKTEHPNPGQHYRGARRTAFLPDNAEGNKVLGLLREAWDRKLTFTIGRSTTTGRDNVVTWNDIHHKTSTVPGHPFGYPDPDYLTRVQEKLAARGVTEESFKLSKSGNAQDFSQFYTPLVPPRPTRL